MFLFGRMCIMESWARKAGECFKHCLMDHPSRSMEDSSAKGDLNCGNVAQEVKRRGMLVCCLNIILVIF